MYHDMDIFFYKVIFYEMRGKWFLLLSGRSLANEDYSQLFSLFLFFFSFNAVFLSAFSVLFQRILRKIYLNRCLGVYYTQIQLCIWEWRFIKTNLRINLFTALESKNYEAGSTVLTVGNIYFFFVKETFS